MKFKFYICYIVLFAISYSQLMDNVDRNAIKSLAIPGWGEKSLNYEERSKLFFIAEASLWISFLLYFDRIASIAPIIEPKCIGTL